MICSWNGLALLLPLLVQVSTGDVPQKDWWTEDIDRYEFVWPSSVEVGDWEWVHEIVPKRDGVLWVWAASDTLDPKLRIESDDGVLIHRDDNAGLGTTALIRVPMKEGGQLRIVVESECSALPAAMTVQVGEFRASEEALKMAGPFEAKLASIKGRELERPGSESLAEIEEMWRQVREIEGWESSPACWYMRELIRMYASRYGNHALAIELLESEITDNRRVFPASMGTPQKNMTDLAQVYLRVGRLEDARVMLEEALEWFAGSGSHIESQWSQQAMQSLAIVYSSLGQHWDAMAVREDLLDELLATRSPTDLDLLRAKANLGNSKSWVGDLESARVLHEQAYEGFSQIQSEGQLDLEKIRLELGNLEILIGDLERGVDLVLQALLAIEGNQLSSPESIRGARTSYAFALSALGEKDEAVDILQQVLNEVRESPEASARELLQAELHLSGMFKEANRARAAREHELVAYELIPTLEPDDEVRTQVLRGLTWSHLEFEETSSARSVLSELRSSVEYGLKRRILSASPRAISSWTSSIRKEKACLFNLYWRHLNSQLPEMDRSGIVLAENLRCVGARTAALRSAMASSELASSACAHAMDASSRVKEAYHLNETQNEILKRTRVLEIAEADLARSLGEETSQGLMFDDADLRRLEDMLPENQALIGYWVLAAATALGDSENEVLMAYVIRRGGRTSVHELASVESVRVAVRRWRGALGVTAGSSVQIAAASSRAANSDTTGHELRQLVFDPLTPALEGVQSLVLAGDDAIHLIPFDSLPTDQGHLGDEYAIHTRTSFWELLQGGQSGHEREYFVGFGGLDFGERSPDPDAAATSVSPLAVTKLMRGAQGDRSFSPLPGSGDEILEIGEEMVRNAQLKAITLTGTAGTRAALVEAAPLARVLHFATHGWSGLDPGRFKQSDGDLETPLFGESNRQVAGTYPMLLSGLALSGANDQNGEDDDFSGAITAEELSHLDLVGCELVVLSACDSGTGITRLGQGVASLQSALQQAGAKSSLASLWPVPNVQTKELMLDFYSHLLDGKTKPEALWLAKRRQRELHRPARYWAGWVLAGNPNPIDLRLASKSTTDPSKDD